MIGTSGLGLSNRARSTLYLDYTIIGPLSNLEPLLYINGCKMDFILLHNENGDTIIGPLSNLEPLLHINGCKIDFILLHSENSDTIIS